MSSAKFRAGALLLLIAAVIAVLTMPVHRLWGTVMLFVLTMTTGAVCLLAGLLEPRNPIRHERAGEIIES